MDFLDFIRKVAEEKKGQWIAKHYGPGPHPSGSPQSVHSGGKRKGRTKGGKARVEAGKQKGKPKKRQRLGEYLKEKPKSKWTAQDWLMGDIKGYANLIQKLHHRAGGKRGKLSEWKEVILPGGHHANVREARYKRFGKMEKYMEVRHLGVGAPWYRISTESGDFRQMGRE